MSRPAATAPSQPPVLLTVSLAAVGPLGSLAPATLQRVRNRSPEARPDVQEEVRALIERVRTEGDSALREFALRYDHARLQDLEVPRAIWEHALDSLAPPLRAALGQAVENLAAFHRAQLPSPIDVEVMPGVRLRRIAQPLQRAGIYAPGGRAAYPSSVLMGVVPARVAGVREVIVCSPPGADGIPSAVVLAASALAGADRVFAIGGAGAIAALACGTASVPRVDRVTGPGNAWVAEAKRQLNGETGIDCPAGPSEVLIIADATADPVVIAAEMIAQAEHDPDASAVLVTTDYTHIEQVGHALAQLLDSQPRAQVILASLAANGALLYANSTDEAVAFSNDYAPEHLLLLLDDADRVLPSVRNAGTVFLGASSSVVYGDYLTGANHVLPTGRASRSFSGLSTLDYLRWVTVQHVSAEAAARLAAPTAVLAEAEGLPGHALAARMRRMSGASPQPAPSRPRLRMRPAYRQIDTYDPRREPCAVDLSDNTNLFGVCPAAREALREIADDTVTRYPSVYASGVKAAAAQVLGVATENITTGCGSDDLIDSALRAFCEPGEVLAYPDPTFGVVSLFARMNGVTPRPVALLPDFQLDLGRLVQSAARAIYLCSPNNPTGTAFRRSDVLTLLESFDGLVLLDEAYADFGSGNFLNEILASSNGVILRTLSKAWGLAGLRLGIAAGPPDLIAEIEKSRGPYKVSRAAEHAATAALAGGRDWVTETVAQVRTNRTRLTVRLQEMGQRVIPSEANFLLLPLPERASAVQVAARLRTFGVGVRAFPALAGLGDCIRVTVGPWPMMETFLAAHAAVLYDLQGTAEATC